MSTAMEGPEPLRERLVRVTIEALAERGPAGVSLREIARRSGVSHGAPLRHYPSLANLLAHVSAEGFRRLRRAMVTGAEGAAAGARERLAGALRGYCRFGLEQPGLLTLMFRWDLVDLSEAQLATESHGAFNCLLDLIVGAQREGWHPALEPRHLAGAIWCAAHGVVDLWVLEAVQRPTGARTLPDILDPLLATLFGIPLFEGEEDDLLDRGS